jgi:hypothetical protein
LKQLAVSLDLDEVHRHLAIHGLQGGSGADRERSRAAFRCGLPRALDWAAGQGIPLTLFAVAEDARDPDCARALRAASDAGHPVESHSATHPYHLVHLGLAALRREVEGSVEDLAAVTGRRPVGFRAPGYLVDEWVLDEVERAGLIFDASLLPCPAYVAAKLIAIATLLLRGKRSASLPRGVRMAFAPRLPYRPGRPFHRPGDRALIELPVSVSPVLRLPALGTLVGALSESLARRMARAFAGDDLVSLELHAMDFLAGDDPGVSPLIGRQPELARSLGGRSGALGAFVSELQALGFAPVTLEQAARARSATLPPVR